MCYTKLRCSYDANTWSQCWYFVVSLASQYSWILDHEVYTETKICDDYTVY